MAKDIIDEREAIPQEEMDTLWFNGFKLVSGFSEEEYADIGRDLVERLKQDTGYPHRIYVCVVAS